MMALELDIVWKIDTGQARNSKTTLYTATRSFEKEDKKIPQAFDDNALLHRHVET